MKIIYEREMQKQTKKSIKKNKHSHMERVRAKWFYCAVMLGFLELIRKALI